MADDLTNSIIARSFMNDTARRQAETERVDKALWQLIAVSDRLQGQKDAAFERDRGVAAQQAAAEGELGTPETASANPVLQKSADAAYLGGSVKRGNRQADELLKQVLTGMEQSGAYQRTSLQQQEANARNDATLAVRAGEEGGRNNRFAATYGQKADQFGRMMNYRYAALSQSDLERQDKSRYYDNMVKLQLSGNDTIARHQEKLTKLRADLNFQYMAPPEALEAATAWQKTIEDLQKVVQSIQLHPDDPALRAAHDSLTRKSRQLEGKVESLVGSTDGVPQAPGAQPPPLGNPGVGPEIEHEEDDVEDDESFFKSLPPAR